MPPKQWDEEDSDSSTDSAPQTGAAAANRRRFDDEEDDSDVLDSWDAAEDSEAEREKEKKAAEAKAKAAAAAAAAKKPKGQRIAEHQADRAAKKKAAEEESDYEETESERRERLRQAEQAADLNHAADLFGDVGISASAGRARTKPTAAVALDSKDPSNTVDIAKLPLFNPTTKPQFDKLRTTLAPIITANAKKAHYSLFLQDLAKDLAREMPSEQIKKLASSMTALGNEKMREEKLADKSSKKTKAAKTKTSLAVGRSSIADDVGGYDQDDFGDDDFM